ncbi:NAD(P)-binding protein [Stipitochalara longipes BDJ]|nr:NAD(P)-binding protein [Stipitochalara longipes BDJ]
MAPLTLGTVLVTGGCGFLGFYLVHDLLRDPECGPVYVLDRDIESNRHDGATYIQGNITDAEQVNSIFQEIKPRVVFHAASPNPSFPTGGKGDQYATNVTGTEILLTNASESSSVRAFVFSSTVDIYADSPHFNADESQTLWNPSSKTWEYGRTKAMADKIVRLANSPSLPTVSLVMAHSYGVRDNQTIPSTLNACPENQKPFQIGDGKNLVEILSMKNAATAHILAAKALLDSSRASGKVGGEAFIISDGVAVPFWHHTRLIWTIARGQSRTDLVDVTILPTRIALTIASFLRWMYWIFSLGTREPPVSISETSMTYCVKTHTYNTQKARQRLHFNPIVNHDAIMEEAVEWELEKRRLLMKK